MLQGKGAWLGACHHAEGRLWSAAHPLEDSQDVLHAPPGLRPTHDAKGP